MIYSYLRKRLIGLPSDDRRYQDVSNPVLRCTGLFALFKYFAVYAIPPLMGTKR